MTSKPSSQPIWLKFSSHCNCNQRNQQGRPDRYQEMLRNQLVDLEVRYSEHQPIQITSEP